MIIIQMYTKNLKNLNVNSEFNNSEINKNLNNPIMQII